MKTVNVMPRRSGKSFLVKYEYDKAPNDTMVFFCNKAMSKCFQDNNGKIENEFIAGRSVKGCKRDVAIFDEYFLFPIAYRRELYNSLPVVGIKEYLVFGTIEKQFDKFLFQFVCDLKKNSEGLTSKKIPEMLHKYYFNNYETKLIEVEDLYWNYITDSDAKVNFLNRPRSINYEHKDFSFSDIVI